MATLYITEQGAQLKKSGERLLVCKGEETLLDVPAFQVDRILIFGNVHITTHAMIFLLEKGIDVSFLSIRGRLRGRLASVESKNAFVRLAQYDKSREEGFRLELARAFIGGKMRNQRTLLLRYQRNHPEADFSESLETTRQTIAQLPHKKKVESLMGLEGAATAAYFKAFSQMVKQGFVFEKRLRRPAPDPVNALLSFGYTLVTNELGGLVEALGFDPFIGFLHGIRYGRRSLPLDLVEEFRHPVVDMLTLSLINRRVLSEGDFRREKDGGVRLIPEALKRYLEHFERRMEKDFLHPEDQEEVSFRALIRLQAEKLEKAVLEGEAYQPFLVQ